MTKANCYTTHAPHAPADSRLKSTIRGGASNFRILKEHDPDTLMAYSKAGVEACRKKGNRHKFTASESHRGVVVRALLKQLRSV